MKVPARMLAPGSAAGPPALLAEPLSFWGGYDAANGTVLDRWHPDRGRRLAGHVVLMRSGRGSSSGSSVLAEAIRIGIAPAALVFAEPDPIAAVGAIVAGTLYGIAMPVVVVAPDLLGALGGAARLAVTATATGAEIEVIA